MKHLFDFERDILANVTNILFCLTFHPENLTDQKKSQKRKRRINDPLGQTHSSLAVANIVFAGKLFC